MGMPSDDDETSDRSLLSRSLPCPPSSRRRGRPRDPGVRFRWRRFPPIPRRKRLGFGLRAALRKTSPFTRVLRLLGNLCSPRGGEDQQRTGRHPLQTDETMKTVDRVITASGTKRREFSLVGVTGAPQLDGVTAKFSFAGDEAELKYETSQLYPAPKPSPALPANPDARRKANNAAPPPRISNDTRPCPRRNKRSSASTSGTS